MFQHVAQVTVKLFFINNKVMLRVVKYCLFIIITNIMGFHIIKNNLSLHLKMELNFPIPMKVSYQYFIRNIY